MLIENSGVQGSSLPSDLTELDMNSRNMACIEFDTLNQLKQLEKIVFKNRNMPYFPDLDCSNTIPEEDNRI